MFHYHKINIRNSGAELLNNAVYDFEQSVFAVLWHTATGRFYSLLPYNYYILYAVSFLEWL